MLITKNVFGKYKKFAKFFLRYELKYNPLFSLDKNGMMFLVNLCTFFKVKFK